MKAVDHTTFLMVFFALSLAVMAAPLSAQVYKVVDEDGNVTYTDQAPADGSPPVELRPISVIEAPTYEKAPEATGEDAVEGEAEPSLASLRRSYQGFCNCCPAAGRVGLESGWAYPGCLDEWNRVAGRNAGNPVFWMAEGTQARPSR